MEDLVSQYLSSLYGGNLGPIPTLFNFPRIPSGLTQPAFANAVEPRKGLKNTQNESVNVKLQDFQQMYQKYAASLLAFDKFGILPPGHPLYSRQNSIDTLKLENGKLQKENLELRKQIDSMKSKSISHHNF